VKRCSSQVLDPDRAGSKLMLSQWSLLRRRGVIEYLLITAR
jgi:hypothetical protein